MFQQILVPFDKGQQFDHKLPEFPYLFSQHIRELDLLPQQLCLELKLKIQMDGCYASDDSRVVQIKIENIKSSLDLKKAIFKRR